MRVIGVRFNRKEKTAILAVLLLLVTGGAASAFILGGAGTQSAAGDINLDKGLVGWWKLDGNAKDSTPSANNGTLVNSPTLTTDREGKANSAYSFNGTNGDITVSSAFGLGNTNLSFSTWVNNPTSSNKGSFVKIGGTANGFGIGDGSTVFETSGSNILILFEGVRWINTGVSIPTGWHNFVVTINGSGVPSFYLDGVFKNSYSGTSAIAPTTQTAIGGYTGSGGENRFFNGTVDDLRIYNRALSTAEVTALYKEYNPGLAAASGENGLLAWWKMDGNAKDSTPNANNGTASGASLTTDREGAANSAYSFSGSSQDIVSANNIGITGNQARTIAVWFKPSDISVFRSVVNWGALNTINQGFELLSDPNGGVTAHWYGGGNSLGCTCSGPVNVWKFGVITYTGSVVTIYFNGVSAGSLSGVTMATQNSQVRIGGPPLYNLHSYFQGSIDDVRIYNRALSAAEVATLYKEYNSQVSVSSLQSGEVGDWALNGNAKDNTPNSDNGTLTNSPTLTTDREGRANSAYSFNGSSSFIALGAPSALAITGKITISAWVKFAALPGAGNWAYIMGGGYDGTHERYQLRLDATPSAFTIGSYTAPSSGNGASYLFTPTLGTWYNVVGLYDGTNWILYLNGAVGNSTASGTGALAGTANASIGAGYISGSPARFLNGTIDDVRIWNRALSAAEVTALYKEYR